MLVTGSHHWDGWVDNGERPGRFDFDAYLDLLESWGHNFIRLWSQWAWPHGLAPRPYAWAEGRGSDGGPVFDLDRFEPAFFRRLRERVEAAGRRGFYVSVMLFQGWSLKDYGEGNPWPFHPFHRGRNNAGVDGDPRRRGDGAAVHTLTHPAVTRQQERFIERVVEEVGDLPHILYEISNESPRSSLPWQEHMAAHLRRVEAARGVRHAVGLTSPYGGRANRDLLAGSADWISPDHRGGYRKAPPPGTGKKVVLADTDHLWGIGGDARWVWKSVTRGLNPLLMDPLEDDPAWNEIRLAMGAARALTRRMDLARARPMGERASSGYCLGSLEPGRQEVLAYLPFGRGVSINFGRRGVEVAGDWLEPATGRRAEVPREVCRSRHRFRSPFEGEAVLYLRSVELGPPGGLELPPALLALREAGAG